MNELEEQIARQQSSLATEMLKELKEQNKRSHVMEIILSGILVLVIAGFLWYISLPIEETTTTTNTTTEEYSQDSDGNGTNNIIGKDGDIENGKAESN